VESNRGQDEEIRDLYRRLLDGWNRRDAVAMARVCAREGQYVGFDGSVMTGPAAIEAALRPIFADHPTATYVSIVRSVTWLGPEVALLRAVAGMRAPGQERIMPERNVVHLLVAVREDGVWRVAQYQNTPASFDGRPAEREALRAELEAEAQPTASEAT
jgi:uncharacterized protein (TIGR02246 family)